MEVLGYKDVECGCFRVFGSYRYWLLGGASRLTQIILFLLHSLLELGERHVVFVLLLLRLLLVSAEGQFICHVVYREMSRGRNHRGEHGARRKDQSAQSVGTENEGRREQGHTGQVTGVGELRACPTVRL